MAIDTLPLFSASDNARYYVYIYRDPRSRKKKQAIYVGKGTSTDPYRPNFRADYHWLYGSSNRFLHRILDKIKTDGLVPIVEVVGWFDVEASAFALEVSLIARLGRRDLGKGSLCNLSDGGEGISGRVIPEEEKARRSVSGKATWLASPLEKQEQMLSGTLTPTASERRKASLKGYRANAELERLARHVKNAGDAKRANAHITSAQVRERNANATPEQKAKWGASISAGKRKNAKKIGEKSTEVWARPGMNERISASMVEGQTKAWADPGKKAARLEKLHATYAAKRAKKASELGGLMP